MNLLKFNLDYSIHLVRLRVNLNRSRVLRSHPLRLKEALTTITPAAAAA